MAVSNRLAKAARAAPPRSAPSSDAIGRGAIAVEGVSVSFGKAGHETLAIDGASVAIAAGEFVCVLGPSGCGKSTLLNVLAGFEVPSEGFVTLDGKPVGAPGADRGVVFQQPALFPWKSVKSNVAHGPRMAGVPVKTANCLAAQYLDLVGLAHVADAYPHTLSGGMQQRVAIARALVNRPSVLLMDEPFGALDAQTRAMMQETLLRIWSEIRATVVFVTHDIDEAIFLSDRVLIMSAGPGRIIADLPVGLQRPRLPEVAAERAFVEIKRECMTRIRAESLKAFEEQNR